MTYTFEDVCALLIHELGLTLDQIKRLTRYQVRTLYLRGRDEKGKLLLSHDREPKKPPPSHADELRAVFRLRGWPEHKIEERVAETLARQKAEREAAHANRRRHAGNGVRRQRR